LRGDGEAYMMRLDAPRSREALYSNKGLTNGKMGMASIQREGSYAPIRFLHGLNRE